jgi:uncharacterized damage-inducible protein DinB
MGDAMKQMIFGDVEREMTITRRVLEAVPIDKFHWKPHEKSMSLGKLAIHVADLPSWAALALNDDELHIEKARMPTEFLDDSGALVRLFDDRAAELRDAIDRFDMARWNQTWSMKQGGEVMTTKPRQVVFRIWAINHMISHRGVLALYLRLLGVPVPVLYFNSADFPEWVFE